MKYREFLIKLKRIKPGDQFELPDEKFQSNFRSAIVAAEELTGKKFVTRKVGDARLVFCLNED